MMRVEPLTFDGTAGRLTFTAPETGKPVRVFSATCLITTSAAVANRYIEWNMFDTEGNTYSEHAPAAAAVVTAGSVGRFVGTPGGALVTATPNVFNIPVEVCWVLPPGCSVSAVAQNLDSADTMEGYILIDDYISAFPA